MKTATVHEIKQELTDTKTATLIDLCLRLARFKKENKELLTYLLFEANDERTYLSGIKQEMDTQFKEINTSHFYFVKKTLRKILRFVNKPIRYMGSRQAEAELLIYFCKQLNATGVPFEKSPVITTIYNNQVKKIQTAVATLHEDLQYDYLKELALLK